MGRYELKQARSQQFYFVLKAGNGEVILTSEMYTTKAAALSGIASVQVKLSSVNALRSTWPVMGNSTSI
ncbi:YegP family protein [Photobacterium kagoshimensis]|uniref:YegP family protein n=1 Tax=Photobacterium kagoshimensis TaxID=2910242 RepID=UPI003D134CB7